MTAHARLGTIPTLAEQVAELRAMVLDQARRIEALEAVQAVNVVNDDVLSDGRPRAADPAECEDGAPMPRGNWQPVKLACAKLNFSPSGLRKAIARAGRQGGWPWHWYRAGRLWVDLDRAPRKRRPV